MLQYRIGRTRSVYLVEKLEKKCTAHRSCLKLLLLNLEHLKYSVRVTFKGYLNSLGNYGKGRNLDEV